MEGEVQVSEAAPAEAPQVQESPQESNVSQGTPEQSDGKPVGFDRVDFTPEQQERVNRLYGNMKRYEKDASELRSDNQRLINTVNELIAGQQQIVSHLQVSDFNDAESRLKAARDAAWDRGDKEGYHTANDRLNQVILKKSLLENAPKPQQNQQTNKEPLSGERVVNRALDRGELTPVDVNIAKAWMSETDSSGNLKRPWTSEGDPGNYAAALEGQAVFNSPQWQNKPIAEKLKEIDRRMGLQVHQTVGQNVLPSGNLTRPKQNNNISLDPEIERLAVRTKFGGPSAKSDQDHIEAWKKAVLKSQPKGARR